MASDSITVLDDYMMDYHPYNNGQNPLHYPDSQTLVYLKMGIADHNRKLWFYARVIEWITGVLQTNQLEDKTVVLTIAPSSDPQSPPSFMHEIIGLILASGKHPNMVDGRTQLQRTVAIPKQSTFGGIRTKDTHRGSIKVVDVNNPALVQDTSTLNSGKVVIILDDVWTSGCTLSVCKEKMVATGALDVVLLAIGKTVSYNMY